MSDNILEDIAGAGDLGGDFAPNLDVGEHVVCLSLVEQRGTREYGKKIDVEYTIVSSSCHRPGEVRGDVFFIQKNGDAGLYARKRANALSREVVKSLGGDPDDTTPVTLANGKTMPKGQAMVVQTLGKLLDKTQPGKGILLSVSTRKRLNKEKTKEHSNNTYAAVTQTKEEIGKRRQAMEGAANIAAAAAKAAEAPASAAPAPAPITTTAAAVSIDGLF